MKFKSPTDTPVQIVLLSGHSTNIGPEFEEVADIFINEALARGCLPESTVRTPSTAKVEAGAGAQGQNNDPKADYRKAIVTMLDRSEDGDFTGDGLPNNNAVSKLVGFRAVKEDVLEVFREMKAEAEAAEAAEAAKGAGAQGQDTETGAAGAAIE